MKLLVGFGDLLRELLRATGQSAQRGLGGVFGVAELVSWAESGAGRNQLQGGQVPQLLAQLCGTGDDQGLSGGAPIAPACSPGVRRVTAYWAPLSPTTG